MIESPLSKGFVSNAYIANYFTDFLTPSTDNPTLATYVPSAFLAPYFEFRCKNAAADSVNRIRVFIRSWSKHSNFSQLANSSNSSNATDTETNFSPDPYCDRPSWYGNGVCSFCTKVGSSCTLDGSSTPGTIFNAYPGALN